MNKNTLSNYFKKQEIVLSNQKRVLMLDGHNLIFRMIFVSAMVGKRDHLSENETYEYWKYLMTNNILNLIKKFNPTRVVLTLDAQNNWRKDIYAEYKAKRKVDRDNSIVINFETFWPVVNEYFDTFTSIFKNIVFLTIDRCEGDDIIAILTKEEMKNGEVIVVTSDKDFIQLLSNKNVSLYNPIKQKMVTSTDSKKELDIKIISGDKSDGIPAIRPKIGVKTAEKILKEGIDIYMQDEMLKANYERNRKIIDFNFIPTEIQNIILKKYQEFIIDVMDKRKLFTFLTNCNVSKILENYSQYSPCLNVLK
jgi:5'-3' exonuclease